MKAHAIFLLKNLQQDENTVDLGSKPVFSEKSLGLILSSGI